MEKKEKSKRIGIRFNLDCEKLYLFGDTIEELIEAAKELKDVRIILCLSEKFPNLSKEQLKELQAPIIVSENAEYIYNFAMSVEGSDISRLQDAIIASEDAYYIYFFAKEVERDLHKVNKAVKRTRNSELIKKYRRYRGKRFLF